MVGLGKVSVQHTIDFSSDHHVARSDMRNRMGARRNIPRFASWTPIFPGDDPEWKAWRARKFKWDKKDNGTETDDTSTSTPEEELCRSLRGFIARKPSTTPSE